MRSREEGIEIGREETLLEIAKELKNEKMAITKIAKITKLTEEKIKEL